MGTLRRDLRYAIRILRRNPVFTSVAVVTLALGIGLNTAVFSAVEALLLRPLPGARAPDRLVQLYRAHVDFAFGANSIPHVRDLGARATDVFEGVAAWNFVPINFSAGGRTERIVGQMVSASFFDVMGARLARGRGFLPEEDRQPGAHQVAVISDAAWRGMFGGDPAIIGREMILNGRSYEIVGVTEPAFKGAVAVVQPAMWVPLMQIDQIMPGGLARLDDRGWSFLQVHARLADGVTVAQARERMAALTAQLAEEHPTHYTEWAISLIPQSEAGMNPAWREAQVALSTVIMGVVLMLLLIACVNVANLFLARARDRWREMAVRLSLGAERSRLIRQLMTESLVFSLAAGTLGLALAWSVIRILNGISLPIDIPITPDLRLNVPVLLFAFGISIVTGLLFGLVPALQATRPSLIPALKGEAPAGDAGGRGRSRSRMSRTLVVAQIALSLVLLVAAGLFLRNLRAATEIETGFESGHLLLASVDPALQGYDRARTEDFYARLLGRLRVLPGVSAAGLGEIVPLGLGSQQRGVSIPGYTPRPDENMSLDYNIVGPGYFEAMGIPILRGRAFTERDDSTASSAIIINERFAERYLGDGDVLYRIVRVSGRQHFVIGVVPDGKYRSLGEDPLPFYYLSQSQWWQSAMTIHVRTAGDPAAVAPLLRAEVRALDPDLPLADVSTMTSYLGIALLPARLAGTVLSAFGALGLVLAAVGIYGVMAYGVAQRRREIGIRVAIGARGGQVVRLVMRQGMTMVAIGAVVGLAGAFAAWRLVRGMLYGATGPDAMTFIVVPTVLITVALVAIWIPARRAARIDPVIALKSE